MIYLVVAACVTAGLIGVKKTIFGGLSGFFLAPFVYCLLYDFELFIFAILFPIGFVLGLFLGGMANNLFRFSVGDFGDDKYKPHFRSMNRGSGGAAGGGIVYTDEEEKNAKENQGKR